MTAQEKQATLYNLQVVTPIFQEFEAEYENMVALQQQKRASFIEYILARVKAITGVVSGPVILVIGFIIALIPAALVVTVIHSIAYSLFRVNLLVSHNGPMMVIMLIIAAVAFIFIIRFLMKKARNRYHAIEVQIDGIQQRCNAIRQQLSKIDMSWYPPDYYCSDAALFFHKAIRNGMCESLGEAVVLYEDKLYKDQVLANQQKQIDLAYKQCILQEMTIATIVEEGMATRQAIHAEGAASRQQSAAQYNDFLRRFGKR